MSILSKPYFHDEKAAFEYVESILWADGPECPHCGGLERAYKLEGVRTKASRKNPEGKERHGLWKCGHCRKQFTVRKGTIFEESHLPLTKWLQAIYLMVSSKKGISAHQLHRVLEVQYKTAWFLAHRIREAMREGAFDVFGNGGGGVEVDETFFGKEPHSTAGRRKRARSLHDKMKVLTLVDRNTKQARSMVIDSTRREEIVPILNANLSKEAYILTDEARQYQSLSFYLSGQKHDRVNHGKGEYVSFKNPEVHTQTVENYYSVFKRGMKGTYQHCAKHHLHRYLAEFDFRYNHRSANGVEDGERAALALRGVKGKRLTYQNAG
ncbi:IS1595 family transposase [Henriciella marina]|uniref:IS1595 family transposase n=1 Tax=Henriciella marina TaxID=453851 RepID=A0ABT4LWA2_9PROT|nr:IS1595 family transposase [Henriciella marina]MCZ4298656.1 IS1595 family transposase [Henriciella marina]